jgi:hypothetical protein
LHHRRRVGARGLNVARWQEFVNKKLRVAACLIAIVPALSGTMRAAGDHDISLFDGHGKAAAYVANDDEMTVYLWSGEPLAYLDGDSSDGFDVYGFNGQHLGWFVNGIIWDHEGKAACATKTRLLMTPFEPFKSFKQFKPVKSVQRIAPLRPRFVQTWSDVPCKFWLAQGEK